MRSWSILIGLLATGCATVQRPAPDVAAPPAAVLDHHACPQLAGPRAAIRSSDPSLRSLLIEGCTVSPTLRALADDIGRTDGVVYITTGACPIRALRGCLLHKIQDTGNARYLWIRVTANADAVALVGTMAHELQHALEILERTDVRSQRDLLELYQSVGSPALRGGASPFRAYETSAAIDVTEAVQAELRNGSGMNDRH